MDVCHYVRMRVCFVCHAKIGFPVEISSRPTNLSFVWRIQTQQGCSGIETLLFAMIRSLLTRNLLPGRPGSPDDSWFSCWFCFRMYYLCFLNPSRDSIPGPTPPPRGRFVFFLEYNHHAFVAYGLTSTYNNITPQAGLHICTFANFHIFLISPRKRGFGIAEK